MKYLVIHYAWETGTRELITCLRRRENNVSVNKVDNASELVEIKRETRHTKTMKALRSTESTADFGYLYTTVLRERKDLKYKTCLQ